MAKNDNGFEQMMDIWQEGQSAFFKAQKEVMDGFQKSLGDMGGAMNSGLGSGMPFNTAEPLAAWQSFIKSWAPQWDASAMMGQMGKADMFTKGRDQFMAMLDPANWTAYAPEQLRTILESIAEGPKFADLATPHIDAAEAWRETLDYQQAAANMAKVLQEAWGRTYETYAKDYSLEDLQSGKVQEALDAWLAAANAELLETQRSKEFMEAQRGMLRASMEIKARQKDMAEAWSEAYQIPTRTEVDDLTKIVHELRREVRKLKREVSAKVGK
ncbi:poly(R)-hydroxyalkanoic acid synthase subunit PhaE [Pseudahrensia aquimaris]|uniref:Poly(3-hydroxyalkanoate) polymerase subunit PhaE n=1 Tax=Pseudahrensia aquimaris TaxID=744461 RepID=A0ABW3FKZ7_9HYPH